MFDDPNGRLQWMMEQLQEAEDSEPQETAQKRKRPISDRYAERENEKLLHPVSQKNFKLKDDSLGLWLAAVLELTVILGVVIWWQIWK